MCPDCVADPLQRCLIRSRDPLPEEASPRRTSSSRSPVLRRIRRPRPRPAVDPRYPVRLRLAVFGRQPKLFGWSSSGTQCRQSSCSTAFSRSGGRHLAKVSIGCRPDRRRRFAPIRFFQIGISDSVHRNSRQVCSQPIPFGERIPVWSAGVLFFSLFQWILPNYSMNSSGRCSNWCTTAGEN